MTEVSSHRQVLLELTHKLRVDANAFNRQMIESAFQEVRTSLVVYWEKYKFHANNERLLRRTIAGCSWYSIAW
jgi:hypothetical protein